MTIFLRWIYEIRRQMYKSHISRIKSEKTIWFFLFENFNFLTNRITRMEISIKRKFRIFLYVKVIFIFIWIFQSLDGAYCRNGELQLKNNIEKKKKKLKNGTVWKFQHFEKLSTLGQSFKLFFYSKIPIVWNNSIAKIQKTNKEKIDLKINFYIYKGISLI